MKSLPNLNAPGFFVPDARSGESVSPALARRSCVLTCMALLTMTLCAADARADELEAPMFVFSGFGTLGVVRSSEDRADFVSDNVFIPNGAGHTRRWSGDVDSVIAVQANANLTPRLSAVVQVVSEQNYANSYRPRVEWANVKYAFTPDFSFRVGRVVLPGYLVSDYRRVGYAMPWVRPPIEVYTLLANSSSDGVDVSYRLRVGELTNTLQGTYGESELKASAAGGTIEGRNAGSLTYRGEYRATTLHVAYVRADLTAPAFNRLFAGFRRFGPEGVAIADRYDVNDRLVTFVGIGAAYDPGDWFVMGEWGTRDTRSVLGERTSWYVSSGYRSGNFTPYVTYAQTRGNSNTSDPGLTLSGLPPALAGAAAGLNGSLNAILGNLPTQKTVSLGARWDFARSAALKLQFDHTRIDSGSSGMLINRQPGFEQGGTFNVFSATLDFVF